MDESLGGVISALGPSELHLRALVADDSEACRLWRACELCIFLEQRFASAPDPRSLSETDLVVCSDKGLMQGERLSDPRDPSGHRPYWLYAGNRLVGTLALCLWETGWGQATLWLASLYVLPECRHQGHASAVLNALYEAASQQGLRGLRLDTDWVWQSAVRLYLGNGFQVCNWKRTLSLQRLCHEPGYRVRFDGDRAEYFRDDIARPILVAENRGDRLDWDEGEGPSGGIDTLHAASTFALWLAVAGWPLIRSPDTWAERNRWIDVGMPEGLAHRIAALEEIAHRHGFLVQTPRIPGLPADRS
ncbi:MAG: GNAT family N-acetyltransferase [Chromatiaceae bacterium]